MVDITWQLELGWLSKMAHPLGWPLSGLDILAETIDQTAYLRFLHITWTSHSMTASLSWYSNRQKQLEAASLLKPGRTQLPFSYVLLGSFPDPRRGDKHPPFPHWEEYKRICGHFLITHFLCVSPNQGLWDSRPIQATAVLISSLQALTHFAQTRLNCISL